MYRLATCFWVSLRTLSPQGLSIAPVYLRRNDRSRHRKRRTYATNHHHLEQAISLCSIATVCTNGLEKEVSNCPEWHRWATHNLPMDNGIAMKFRNPCDSQQLRNAIYQQNQSDNYSCHLSISFTRPSDSHKPRGRSSQVRPRCCMFASRNIRHRCCSPFLLRTDVSCTCHCNSRSYTLLYGNPCN